MTKKENYLKTLRGEKPEWVPNYHDVCEWIMPSYPVMVSGSEDCLGVHWTRNDAGMMVDTTKPPVMSDIAMWRDFVHLPDPDSFDWEELAKRDLAGHDPEKAFAVMFGIPGGMFFIPLMNMMGFEEGLCALLEEEETVKEMFDHMMAWYRKIIPNVLKYYKPDIFLLSEDICTAMGPFVSWETYEKLFRPYYQEMIQMARPFDVIIEFHMCGKCEVFLDDLVDMGVQVWQPAQPMNDLDAIKKKYGNRLVLNGAWDTSGPGGVPGASEETVRESVRDCMDKYAVGGGYVFWNGDPVGTSEDMKNKMAWTNDEATKYGETFYR